MAFPNEYFLPSVKVPCYFSISNRLGIARDSRTYTGAQITWKFSSLLTLSDWKQARQQSTVSQAPEPIINGPEAEMTAPTPHPPGTKSSEHLSVQNGFTVKGHVLQLESSVTKAPEHWIASSRIRWTTVICSINCRKERRCFNCPVTHSRIQCIHIRLSAMGDALEKQIGKTVD